MVDPSRNFLRLLAVVFSSQQEAEFLFELMMTAAGVFSSPGVAASGSPGGFQRDHASHECAAAAGALYFEGAANEAGPVVHDPQSHAGGAALQVGKGYAIILNGEC